MIKILEPSRFHDLTTTCQTCGCTFQFDISDCELSGTRYANGQPFVRTFKIDCPICKSPAKFDIMIQPQKEEFENA